MRSGLALSLLVTLISGAIPARAADLEATPSVQQPADQDQLERLVRLEQALQESRQRLERQQADLAAEIERQQQLARELAALRHQIAPSSTPTTTATTTPPETTTPAATPTAAVRYSPGRGFTITAGEASLQVSAEARLLGFSNSRYMFNPGQPLVVSPKKPDISYDFSAQQSTVTAVFRGPRWGSWTPGAFALFTLQDNILAEGYSFTPVAFYGEASDGLWRIAAGQNFDIFAPRDPDNLPNGKLATSGNPGAYRPQLRVERRIPVGADTEALVQVGVSSPITTALPQNVDLARLDAVEIVEDNGWPNVEGRLNLGFGQPQERAGGRVRRPVELGVSGVIGQLRVLDNLKATDLLTLVADRSVVEVWGGAFDGQISLGRSIGLTGEAYHGQGLGQYMAGILQSYNRSTNAPVPTTGGWGQLHAYLGEKVRLAVGFGVDQAIKPGRFGLKLNETAFANVIWDVSDSLQLGLEGNYRLTTYDSFGDKEGWVVISQVLFRL
jgi:hypothetical protein